MQTVQSGPSAARLRGIDAASAPGAPGRASQNPPVVGSSPTRPTCDFTRTTGHLMDRTVSLVRCGAAAGAAGGSLVEQVFGDGFLAPVRDRIRLGPGLLTRRTYPMGRCRCAEHPAKPG